MATPCAATLDHDAAAREARQPGFRELEFRFEIPGCALRVRGCPRRRTCPFLETGKHTRRLHVIAQ